MNDMLEEFCSPYEEWTIVAAELVREDPEATMWDLIKCMYEYKTGCELGTFPDERRVVEMHMDGFSKSEIAEELGCDTLAVGDILASMGFTGFRVAPSISPFEVKYSALNIFGDFGEGIEVRQELGEYMWNRCIKELKVYAEYRKNERIRSVNT